MLRSNYIVKINLFCFFSIVLISLGFYLELNSTTSYLSIISIILCLIILFSCAFLSKGGLINPLTVYSLMYSGYVLGGLYYATTDGYFGKFIGYINLERGLAEEYLIKALLFSIMCYVCFVLGYVFQSKQLENLSGIRTTGFTRFIASNYLNISIPLLIIGVFYWVWVCYTIAGSVTEALILFQVFPHLVEKHEISTLPYLLYFAGSNIWLMGIVLRVQIEENSKGLIVFSLVALLGFIISLSTARITISVTYVLAHLVFVYFVLPKVRRKIIIICFMLLVLAFFAFFLRELSNYYYLNNETDNAEFGMFQSIVGGGNITDLQQIVIIFYSFELQTSLLGASYLDWLNNSVGVLFGFEPTSIGLLVHEKFIPSSSGAPTPGSIGEAYANFNFLAPFFMLLVGWFFSYLHNFFLKTRNIFALFVYSNFLVCFVFMYPKVDSTMLINFIWGAMPTVLIILIFYFFYFLLPKKIQ